MCQKSASAKESLTLEKLYNILKANTDFYVTYYTGEDKKQLYTLEGGYDNIRLIIKNGTSFEFFYCERDYINTYKELNSEDELCRFYINFHLNYDEKVGESYWEFLRGY